MAKATNGTRSIEYGIQCVPRVEAAAVQNIKRNQSHVLRKN
jgi:hypothetical protein